MGLSQSKLARLSGVSRFKLCAHELGAGSLTPEELRRICDALQAESDRLRNVLIPTPSAIACAETRDV
jgi:predicted transcriptional regulator